MKTNYCRQRKSRMLGRIKNFNYEKGYGFIRPDDGGKDDHFLHVTALHHAGIEQVNPGDTVEYDLEEDQRSGKMRATDLRLLKRASAL
jgi:cold shock protein